MLISASLILSVIMPCTNYASPGIGHFVNLVHFYIVLLLLLLLFPYNLCIYLDLIYSILIMHQYLFVLAVERACSMRLPP